MANKLFVSLPMTGHKEEEIRKEMDWMKGIFDRDIDEDYELIDTLDRPNVPRNVTRGSIWNFGHSIERLAEADLVLFHPMWRESRGCIMEHMICALYGIPYIELTQVEKIDDIIEENANEPIDSQEKLRLV